ncbi:MAG: type II secretion system protein E [Syntrophus sp. (in: bacteria)]|nr:type II secretion system protein E [Syntrophus sp. (in: bacteria)]
MATIKLGDILIEKGMITDKQLQIALIQQRVTGDLLGDVLVKLGFISSKERTQILAEQSGVEFYDLGSQNLMLDDALKVIPKAIAEKNEFIPIEMENGRLSIGITNPGNILAIDTVSRITKNQPKVYLVDSDAYNEAVDRSYFFLENPVQQRIDSVIKEVQRTGTLGGNDVVSLADTIIMDGIRKNTTDIHINPAENVVQIFFRIDGVLQFAHCLPKVVQSGVVSRIKILSQLNIAETRLPQDGAFTYNFLNRGYDIRISTAPTIYGENVVMRILTGKASFLRLENLGFDSVNTEKVKNLFQKPYGIILVTGPTGSGKTTTLYAALREINILERNVLTVEDPVEYKLSFVKQTQVNEKAGYDFALAGRTFMRQDPDVILLGEIRDEETARLAIRASVTGHLVISTLHTNDALTAVPRLIDLDVDRYMLSASLLAIIAQRLIRKTCVHCKTEYDLNDMEISILREYEINATKGFRGKGCPKCNLTGYSGRTMIGEILVVNDEMRELIYSAASITTMKGNAIKGGMRLLKVDALMKAVQGITTIEEALRVAG